MGHCFQYIMERSPTAAHATNPHWHIQSLTVVYGESGPPAWMRRITMAWHSLWINRASWHGQLTVSNYACDLCSPASNILLEKSHKSRQSWLTVYPISHTPCFNCPVWRWCKYGHTCPLAFTAFPVLSSLSRSVRRAFQLSKSIWLHVPLRTSRTHSKGQLFHQLLTHKVN